MKQPLRIAVNTRLLLKNKLEGIGWFSFETLRRIVKAHPEVEFYFLFDRPWDASFVFAPNVHPVALGPQARHPLLFVLWFEWSVPRALKRIRPDLFLSPDGYLSLRLPDAIPQFAVMHDLNFEHFPADLPWLVRYYYRYFFPRFARKARRIATVSQFSKDDIVAQYAVAPSKVDVVYNGANEDFVPIAAQEVIRVRQQYAGGAPYFMFVGSLHPRKNLARLFTAFDMFKKEDKRAVKLLIVGEKKWWTPPIKKAYEAMDSTADVIFAGRLEPNELRLVTASALASVYVSYFEGFGIPIVEAFRCGVPVLTASATATAEVAGDAALLVDPYSVGAIAEGLALLANDESLRKNLSTRGLERARQFTWDAAASRLWESISRSLEG